jgi:hypothetical protein
MKGLKRIKACLPVDRDYLWPIEIRLNKKILPCGAGFL